MKQEQRQVFLKYFFQPCVTQPNFVTKYNLIRIDPTGINIAKACYLLYDS